MSDEQRSASRTLLACPFCGDDEPRFSWSSDQEVVNVRCRNWMKGCMGAGANCHTEEEARRFWNTRTPLSETTPAMGPCSCQDSGQCKYINGGPACMNEDSEDAERYRWFRQCPTDRQQEIMELAGEHPEMLDHHIDKGRCGL